MQREYRSLPPDSPIAAQSSSLLIFPFFPDSFTLSDPEPTTYNDMYTRVKQISSGLYHLGLGKDNWRDEDGKERVGVYADTSLNWQLFSHSLARMGHPLTTAYTTLGPEGLQHSLAEPSVRMVFTNAALLPTLLQVVDDCPNLVWVVYDGEDTVDQDIVKKVNDKLAARERPGRILSLDEVVQMGKENMVTAEDGFGGKPSRKDLYCIMYTSGSTGKPKGVMLTHDNIICSLAGTRTLLEPLFRDDDLFLAFLPLAHILELLVEMTFYFCGVPVAYGTVKTLTNESVRKCQGDLASFKPTIIVGVPAIYELIRKGMVKKIHESPALVQQVFNLAYVMKKNVPLVGGILDKAVFAKVKQATGGKLRLAMNGGAALSRATQEFLTTTLVTMLQGYGATETCGMCAILTPEFFQLGSVGVIVPSLEVKLQDYPEAGYLTSNNPPQGEVWLRGGSVTKGYYKRPELNKESFTDDGWFKTGDIGQFAADGTLSLIDRIKNLVKLRSGEYLALEKLESVYGSCDISQNLCVYANSEADKPIAIVFPHEGNLRNHLKSANIGSEAQLEDLCKDPKVKDYIKKQLLVTGQKGGLKGPELLQDVIVDSEAWVPDNNKVTATNKTNRTALVKIFDKQIKASLSQ
ncbi:hypothetical protein QFC20_007535 [Naganishia adeliensis]|uniref:Uncharacterized protein n=1 Tax=Naganishia adeliensis TaxID=92952 RepID=A0ACC2UY68_9TREE|nr:hypothetical protein QFC20_007535 [Naganishia adeliensis]